jgi:hypothetical protein
MGWSQASATPDILRIFSALLLEIYPATDGWARQNLPTRRAPR